MRIERLKSCDGRLLAVIKTVTDRNGEDHNLIVDEKMDTVEGRHYLFVNYFNDIEHDEESLNLIADAITGPNPVFRDTIEETL